MKNRRITIRGSDTVRTRQRVSWVVWNRADHEENLVLKRRMCIMKKKRRTAITALVFSLFLLAGCTFNGTTAEIPYPDTYYVHPAEEKEEEKANTRDASGQEENSEKDTKAENAIEPENIGEDNQDETEQKTSGPKTEKNDPKTEKTIHFFLDTSMSMQRSPQVIPVYAAAIKCGAGFDKRSFYGMGSQQNLVETTEELALSGKYGNGAPLDLVEKGSLPCEVEGVNVLTTDLQSNTSSARLGQYLVSTGCTGFSFYVFHMQYDGSLEFKTYTSSMTMETVSVSDCSFDQKEFLLIVFGEDQLVQEFDANFQDKLKETDETYDVCHTSMPQETETQNGFLKLTASKCFSDDIPNVTYDNNHYIFGMQQIEENQITWTCENTFVYRKSQKSVGRDKQAVKAVFYASPEESLPELEQAVITQVQKYNSKTKTYEPSETEFTLETEISLDGFPAVIEEKSDAKIYEKLQKDLGGMLASGPVLAITIENRQLPKGLYAVETQLKFAADSQMQNLEDFAKAHSAGLEKYSAALESECVAKTINGEKSSSRYSYRGNKSGTSVFCKLLDFERVADELLAAGAENASDGRVVTVRLVIDNR